MARQHQTKKMKELYVEKEMSLNEIARELGYKSASSIKYQLERMGIKRRTISESKKGRSPRFPNSYFKGKTWEEIYGEKGSKDLKLKISKMMTGKNHPKYLNIPRETLYQRYIVEKKSCLEIAKEFNTNHRTILNRFEKFNIPKRTTKESLILSKLNNKEKNPNFKKISKKLLIQKYIIERKSTIEIAKELNIDRGTVSLKLKYHGIKVRNDQEALIAKWENKEFREKTIKAVLKGLMKRPTSFEKKIIFLCSKYRLPFIYTGDGRILINYKNPDFVNETNKIIIEVFLNYFKERDYRSIENYIKIRSDTFAEKGYTTVFIREEEITDKNWENICLNKIREVYNEI